MMDNVKIFDKTELEEFFICNPSFDVYKMNTLIGQMTSGRIDAEQTMFYLETILPEVERTDLDKLYNTMIFMMMCSSSEKNS